MIWLDRVTKRFGSTDALVGVSFAIPEAGLVGLLGPNGAGKTTAMRIIAGSITPDSGSVRVAGRSDPAGSIAARRAVGYLPEAASVYPEMSVSGFLRYRAQLFGVARSERRSRIEAVLERCSLGDMRRRRIGTLSKGYKQRVGLAATLLHKPRVLILDEPSNGLDPTQLRGFRALLRELAEDRAVLLSTHVLAEVETVAERVIVLARGRVVHDGPLRGDGASEENALIVRVRAAAGTEVGTDVARVAGALLAIDSVDRVEALEHDEGWHRVRVVLNDIGADADDVAEHACRVLSGAGRPPCEVTRERVSLEARFTSLMDAEKTTGAAR